MKRIRSGVVMESKGRQAVVLTPEHEFVRIKLPHAAPVGQEVSWSDDPHSIPRVHWRRASAVAASVLVVGALVTSWWAYTPSRAEAAAYVGVDINPSVELGVSSSGKVISAVGLDADGVQLLHSMKLTGKTLNEAVKELTALAVSKGYLKDASDDMLISVAPASGQTSAELVGKLRSSALQTVQSTLRQDRVAAGVNVIETSSTVLAKAKAADLSPGKYALWLKAQDSGEKLSQKDVRQTPVGQLMHNDTLSTFVRSGSTDASQIDQLYQQFVRRFDGEPRPTDGQVTGDPNPPDSPNPPNPPKGKGGGKRDSSSSGNDRPNAQEQHSLGLSIGGLSGGVGTTDSSGGSNGAGHSSNSKGKGHGSQSQVQGQASLGADFQSYIRAWLSHRDHSGNQDYGAQGQHDQHSRENGSGKEKDHGHS